MIISHSILNFHVFHRASRLFRNRFFFKTADTRRTAAVHIPFLEKNTLQCRLKAAKAELAAFKSGKKYQDMQETHRKEVQDMECRIRQLEEGLAQAHRELKANTRHWFEVFDDLKKEHQKEVE